MSGEQPVSGARPAEPFLLLTTKVDPKNGPVTNEQLAEQIGALATHVGVVHRELMLAREEIADVRGLVLKDHATRITEVERRTPITIPPGVKTAGKYAGVAAIIPVIEYLLPYVQHLLSKAGQ